MCGQVSDDESVSPDYNYVRLADKAFLLGCEIWQYVCAFNLPSKLKYRRIAYMMPWHQEDRWGGGVVCTLVAGITMEK